MADPNDPNPAILNLTRDEKRAFGQLFQQADSDRLGVVTGEIAVKFFEKTRLPPSVLGEIWQIADSENRGLLTKAGFCVALRLIGHCQAGEEPRPELGFKPGPIPKFDGVVLPPAPNSPVPSNAAPTPLQPQASGSIRIPPLSPEKINQYSSLFQSSGAQDGTLSGESAKAIFERAGLPNEVLGKIWGLADREGKGALGITEFIIAMHLITSYKSRVMTAIPSILPPGLYEAASRRGVQPPSRQSTGMSAGGMPRQFTGPQRTSSPLARQQYVPPSPQSAQPTGANWLVTPAEKAKYDEYFTQVDTSRTGFLTGDQAVQFFSNSGLDENALASIWDLADIRSEGQLNRDEFAVAMYLIRQQRSGSAPLPAFLPAALVPPSMRSQAPPPQHTTAPAFDNANNTSQLPKSASEDLFGLDASPPRPAPPAPVQTQTMTGSSVGRSPFDADPFEGSKPSSPISPQRQAFQPQTTGSGIFKPFMPTSAFGATLASQHTGGSTTSSQVPAQGQQRQVQATSAADDLLGDNDNEESKNISDDTAELGNMSTQIGNLRNQMQDVQTKKTTGQRDLTAVNQQKQEMQQRLSQFRSQYEQEVQAVKSLEQQLATSRSSTQKLQQEMAMVEGTHQDLQTQHQQIGQQLQADQQENFTLKERISQLNAEIAQLRPQIEKMRSEARQQKGMVAINKKQLATSEGERDKLKTEQGDLSRAAEEAKTRNVDPPTQPASAVVSPAPSTSTNPFFRKSSQQRVDGVQSPGVQSPGAFMASAPSPTAFDTLFGPSFSSQQQSRTATPPPTSFGRPEQTPVASAASGQSVSTGGRPTPSASPPMSTSNESPRDAEPPAPPASRQFTPGILPMRPPQSRGQSVASSTRAAPAASRMGEDETPAINDGGSRVVSSAFDHQDATRGPQTPDSEAGPADNASFLRPQQDSQRPAISQTQSAMSIVQDNIPGAFPSDSPAKPGARSVEAEPESVLVKAPIKDDFESAFAGFGEPQASSSQQFPDAFAPHHADETETQPATKASEFPPIEHLEHEDEESDSDYEGDHQRGGFEDDFGSSSAAPNGVPTVLTPEASESARSPGIPSETSARPTVATIASTASDLPNITAQQSPPTYDQAVPGENDRQSPNHFPPEFTGLLPAREDPTASPVPHSIPQAGSEQSSAPTQRYAPDAPAPSIEHDAFHEEPRSSATEVPSQRGGGDDFGMQTPRPAAPKSAFDDAFADFDNLDEARTEDDRGFDFSGDQSEAEFNPTFDSPAASMMTGMASSQQTPVPRSAQPATSNGFHDFESNINNQQSSSHAFGGAPSSQSPQNSNHDWDAIFSGLDTPGPNVEQGFGGATNNRVGTSGYDTPTPKAHSPPPVRNEAPNLGRAVSSTSVHDDPILKRLTGMGYPRAQALDALEKYDYDINKAVDHLTSS